MSAISDFNHAAVADNDHEHGVQLDLLRELCKTAEKGDSAAVGELLQRLTDFCEAHFASEELLMRMKSYDDYEEHVEDHTQMLDALSDISASHRKGDRALISGRAHEMLEFLSRHIATRDRRFADAVRAGL